MNVTPQEALAALEQVDDAALRTQKMRKYALGDVIYVTWGIICVLMNLAIHTYAFEMKPPRYEMIQPVCMALITIGIAVCIVMNVRNAPTRNPAQKRLGWRLGGFWLLLYAYVTLWGLLLGPFFRVSAGQQAEFCVRYGAISGTIPMFAYVVMGLWLADKVIFATGVIVTLLTLLCLAVLPPNVFYIGMAAAMGGPLIGAGIYCHVRSK